MSTTTITKERTRKAAQTEKKTTGPQPSDADPPDVRVEWIPIDQIDRDGQNHRVETPTSRAKIRSLADDFAHGQQAQLQAVRVYERPSLPYLLAFGFRRVAAAELAGWSSIRAEVYPEPVDRSEVERVRAVENLQRDDLTPVEEMAAVLAFIDALPTHNFYRQDGSIGGDDGPLLPTRDDDGKLRPSAVDYVARALGRDAKWLRDRLYLERLGPKVRKRLVDGKLLLGHAREIAKLGDHAVQDHIAASCELREDGSCPQTIDHLRQWVADHQRSLRIVPWKLEADFKGVKDKRILGACATCPHNSTNDHLLFEHDGKPAEDGFCLHDACFDAKTAASNKAVEKAVATIVRKELPATEKAAGDVAAEFVKPGRVAREAKKAKDSGQQPQPADDGGDGDGSDPAQTTAAPAKREPTPQELAETKLETALGEYEARAQGLCARAVFDYPMRLAALALLRMIPGFGSYQIEAETVAEHADLVAAVARSSADDILLLAGRAADAMAKAEEGFDRDVPIIDDGPPAELFRPLVEGWGLSDAAGPYPKIEDFLPKPAPTATTSEGNADGPLPAPEAFEEETPILDPKDLDVTEAEIFAADAMTALDRMGEKTPPKVKVVAPLLGDTQSRFGIAARIECVVLGTVQCRGHECARLVPTVPLEDWVGDTVTGGAARARMAAGMFDGIRVRIGKRVEVIDEAKWTLHVRVGGGKGGAS